jgi:hypothetical protein
MEKYHVEAFERKERKEERERDKNGTMHAVSVGQNEYGIFISFYYVGGKVMHFMPNRVIPHLKQELSEVTASEPRQYGRPYARREERRNVNPE